MAAKIGQAGPILAADRFFRYIGSCREYAPKEYDIVIAIYHYVWLSMMCKYDIIIGMHDWLLF